MKKLLFMLSMMIVVGVSMPTMAQSSEAGYPVGEWQDDDETRRYFASIFIEREIEDGTSCGTFAIGNQETGRIEIEGYLYYEGRELDKNGMATNVFLFNGETEQGQKFQIGLKKSLNDNKDKGNRTKIKVVFKKGELANHPAFKNDLYSVGAAMGAAFDPTMWVVDDAELIEALKGGIIDGLDLRGFGNVRQFVNSHKNLIPGQPKYAKCKSTTSVNIRNDHNSKAQKIGELKPGMTLYVVDEYNGWCQVQLAEHAYGWVSLSVVTLTNKPSTNTGLTSLTYCGPAFVDGQLAFVGVPLSGYEQTIRPKLIKAGLKIRDKESIEGVIDGVPVYIMLYGNNLTIYEKVDYKLSQAKTRLGLLSRKLEAIYGKANLTYDEEEAKVYEIKIGEHTISIGYHNADELDQASDYYNIEIAFR